MKNSAMKLSERILAMILSIIMIVSVLPINAFAVSEESGDEGIIGSDTSEGDGTVDDENEETSPETFECYTLTIKDQNGNGIKDAEVSYSLTANDIENSYAGNVVSDESGIASILIPAEYSAYDFSVSAKLSFVIIADGYANGTYECDFKNAWGGSSEVSLQPEASQEEELESTVTVQMDGAGFISVGGQCNDENEYVFGRGATIDVIVTSDHIFYSYIESISINGETYTLSTSEKTITETIPLSLTEEEYVIQVKFSIMYEVEIVPSEYGTLTVNGNTESFVVASGTVLSISAQPDASAESNVEYVLDRLSINGYSQNIGEDGKSGFSIDNLSVDRYDVNGKITISAEFIAQYTVEVTYNANGEVTSDPQFTTVENNYGSVILTDGESATISAQPKEGFRVSSVVIDEGEPMVFTENDKTFEQTLDPNKGHTVVVTFSENRYYVIILPEECITSDGESDPLFDYSISATLNNETVDITEGIPYGSEVNVTITPNAFTDYYMVSTDYNSEDNNSDDWIVASGEAKESYTATIDSITGDVTFDITRGYEVSVNCKNPEGESSSDAQYDITVNGGLLNTSSSIVTEGSSVVINIIANDRYNISAICGDPDPDKWSTEDIEYHRTVENLGSAYKIVATIEAAGIADIDFPFNTEDAVKYDAATNTLVFAKGTSVTFAPPEGYDKICVTDSEGDDLGNNLDHGYTSGTISINSDTVINQIRVNADDDGKGPEYVDGTPVNVVFDDADPTVEIKPEALSDDCTVYGQDVTFEFDVQDPVDSYSYRQYIGKDRRGNKQYENRSLTYYSGIKTVEYQIEVDGVIKTVDDAEEPIWITESIYTTGDVQQTKPSITLDAEMYKGEKVVVSVKVTDFANNTVIKTSEVMIDPTEPEVYVSFDSADYNVDQDGNYYFNHSITATVKFLESSYAFNETNANNSIVIAATKLNGESIDGDITRSEWTYDAENGAHIQTITFGPNACYSWDTTMINQYKNNAGIKNSGLTMSVIDLTKSFTVDTDSPTGTIDFEDDDDPWDRLVDSLTFNVFKNTTLTFTAHGSDNTSPIESVLYYKWNVADSDIPDDIDKLKTELDGCTFIADEIKVSTDEKVVVYAKITDCAGNYTYISTDGVIVDKTAGTIALKVDDPDPTDSTHHNKDFNVNIAINDVLSGIDKESVRYEITIVENNETKVLKEDNIRNLDFTDESQTSATASIEITAKDYNRDNVFLTVYAKDRAGNEFKETTDFNINTTSPTATIEYIDEFNNNDYRKDGYFTSRTAKITVIDRATSFNADNATNGIEIEVFSSKDGDIVKDVTGYYTISDWTSNGDEHYATVEFSGNAYYKWSFNYTNSAYLLLEEKDKSTKVSYETDQKYDDYDLCPYAFTVDDEAPTATIKPEVSAWDELLTIITFGIYSNDELQVYATASDRTSLIFVSYFKTAETELLSADELDEKDFRPYTEDVMSINDENILTVNETERFTVYLKVADYAGNYIYIRSGGQIVDKNKPEVTLSLEAPLGGDIYNIANSNVTVTANVADVVEESDISSGIKNVTYKIEKLDNNGNVIANSTQQGELLKYEVEAETTPTYDKLVKSINKTFEIDASAYNWSRVRITVTAEDNAGNIDIEETEIDIDITRPVIDVTYDNNNANNSKYFAAQRTATVVITERANHFSGSDAKNAIDIKAVDVNGNTVDGTFTVSGWTTTAGSTPDTATHKATIKYSGDANYTFAISYTDMAGNANNGVDTNGSVAPYDFTVDKTAPAASISAASAEGRTEKWDKLLTSLNFGFWSNERISISSESSDATSPIASVTYYKASSKNSADFTKLLTASQLGRITSWQSFSSFNIVPNEQAVVYLRVVDKAGNTTYVCTNGLIVDNTSPIEEVMAPQITLTPQGAASGIYSGDVTVSISVQDPLAGGTYSGLKTVSYRVLNMGEVTQSGTLYTFNNAAPSDSQLLSSWNGQIVVDSSLNNSNDVVIEVFGEDNSLNSSTNSISIRIDTTAPTISISYDNNNAVDNYFNEDRVATIVVTERNFSEEEVLVSITNTDGVIPSIGAWTMSAGSGNGDNTRWSAPIVYSADGDYTFDISCTDMAGNAGGEPTFASGTVAPTEFTIDQTDPVINVSYDSQSDNGYYDDVRTATITINEHNFNADDVNVTIVATEDGVAIDAPSVREWTTRGDVHTATIVYSDNAMYSFSISYTDEAANEAESIENQVFYVDKTAPMLSITGVENNSANSGEVDPVIEFSDINIDPDSVVITLSGANRGDNLELIGEYSDIHNGQVFTFDNFEQTQENDDIYTLSVSLSDYAGNATEATITFSVNRFGSTYALSEGTKNIIGSYVTEPDDIVITEINANELSEITVTLFKNNSTIELVEGENYSVEVEGGDGQWYKYTYTVFAENFTDDGVYRINVHSKDKAGNVAENTLDTKATEISFGVDKTPPNVVVTNTESGETYAKESHIVLMNVDDNFMLASVTVYLDGDKCASWSGEELAAIVAENGEFSFEVPGDSTKAHNVEIVTVDAAGNETVEEIEDFFVTTNMLVRYYNNKALFFGSIFGLLLIIALIIFIIVFKRRRREQVRF